MDGFIKLPAVTGITESPDSPGAASPDGIPLWDGKPLPPQEIDKQIDLLAAGAALKKENIVENLVNKKAEELGAKAGAKAASAAAGLSKAEAEKIEAYIQKSEAFFKANSQVLGIIGIRQPLGYKTMAALFPFALTLFLIVAVTVYFPFSVIRYIAGFFMDVIGDIAKKISSNGLRIFLAVLSVILIAGLLAAVYWAVAALVM